MAFLYMLKNGTYTGNKLLEGMDALEKEQFFSLIDLAIKNLSVTESEKEGYQHD